jgi:hypothetical protein
VVHYVVYDVASTGTRSGGGCGEHRYTVWWMMLTPTGAPCGRPYDAGPLEMDQRLYAYLLANTREPEVGPRGCHPPQYVPVRVSVIHHVVHRCSPRHPSHGVPVRVSVIHLIVYRCSPRHPPRGAPVLATSFTTWRTGARHVIHHVV